MVSVETVRMGPSREGSSSVTEGTTGGRERGTRGEGRAKRARRPSLRNNRDSLAGESRPRPDVRKEAILRASRSAAQNGAARGLDRMRGR